MRVGFPQVRIAAGSITRFVGVVFGCAVRIGRNGAIMSDALGVGKASGLRLSLEEVFVMVEWHLCPALGGSAGVTEC